MLAAVHSLAVILNFKLIFRIWVGLTERVKTCENFYLCHTYSALRPSKPAESTSPHIFLFRSLSLIFFILYYLIDETSLFCDIIRIFDYANKSINAKQKTQFSHYIRETIVKLDAALFLFVFYVKHHVCAF